MKHTAPCTALAFSLTLGLAAAPVVAAQPAAVEEDVAPTPTQLTDLLGPDGAETLNIDFYLDMQMPGQGSGIMHWSAKVNGDRLIFTQGQAMNEEEMTNNDSSVYTADGEFVQSSSVNLSPNYKSTTTAVRDGDQVRVTESYTFDNEPAEADTSVHDYRRVENTIPMDWLPVALAYHLREGHEAFQVRMCDDLTGEFVFIQIFTAEDVGTETIEVAGQEHEAHVLMLTMSTEFEDNELDGFDAGEDEEQTMQMYVLADGSIVRMRAEFDGMTMTAEAITAQEAAERMPEVGGGNGGAAGDDGGAAGDALEDAADAIRDDAE